MLIWIEEMDGEWIFVREEKSGREEREREDSRDRDREEKLDDRQRKRWRYKRQTRREGDGWMDG